MAVLPANRISPIPDGAEGAWIPHVRRLAAFDCDATFSIASSFYTGPANGIDARAWEAARSPLPPVDLPRQFAARASTAELIGRETPLIGHYRHLIALARRHGQAASREPFPYFRTKPEVVAQGRILTEFAWNDDVVETRTVLEALAEAGGGPDRLIHADEDQGWAIQVVARAQALCWIEWDAEGPPPVGGYSVDRGELARQAAVALERMRIIHERLVEAHGRDHWTYRPVARSLLGRGPGASPVSAFLAGILRSALARAGLKRE